MMANHISWLSELIVLLQNTGALVFELSRA